MRSQSYLLAALLIATIMISALVVSRPLTTDFVYYDSKRMFSNPLRTGTIYYTILRNAMAYTIKMDPDLMLYINVLAFLYEYSGEEWAGVLLKNFFIPVYDDYLSQYIDKNIQHNRLIENYFGKTAIPLYIAETPVLDVFSDVPPIHVSGARDAVTGIEALSMTWSTPAIASIGIDTYMVVDNTSSVVERIVAGTTSHGESYIELAVKIRTDYYYNGRHIYNRSDSVIERIDMYILSITSSGDSIVITKKPVSGVYTRSSNPKTGLYRLTLMIDADAILSESTLYYVLQLVENDGYIHYIVVYLSATGG